MTVIIKPSRLPKANNYLLSSALMIGAYFAAGIHPLLSIFSGALSFIPLIKAEVSHLSHKYIIKDDELLLEKGVLRKTKTRMTWDNIYTVSFKQGIIERLLNYGTIYLSSWVEQGKGVPTEMNQVRRPKEVAEHLNFMINKNKR